MLKHFTQTMSCSTMGFVNHNAIVLVYSGYIFVCGIIQDTMDDALHRADMDFCRFFGGCFLYPFQVKNLIEGLEVFQSSFFKFILCLFTKRVSINQIIVNEQIDVLSHFARFITDVDVEIGQFFLNGLERVRNT